MRGNVKWQVNEIFLKSGINQIGKSKHRAKDIYRSTPGKDKVTWHEIGKNVGIFSYKTADNYRNVWRQVGEFVKTNFKIKDMEKINSDHIKSFLASKIEANVTKGTFKGYVSAVEKLETALNNYAEKNDTKNSYDFSGGIKSSNVEATGILKEEFKGRSYENPRALISEMKNDDHKLVAKIQFESGCRISEASYIKVHQLRGFKEDPVTGKERGVLFVEKAKGGKNGEKYVSKETYKELESKFDSQKSLFSVNNKNYLESLKNSAQITKQFYNGSHGLRWSFAQERLSEVLNVNSNSFEAHSIVSKELFHERTDITKHYLQKN